MVSCRVFLVIIALVRISNTATSESEDIDICNMRNGRMYCNCEPVSRRESSITCFIFNQAESDDELWSAFGHTTDDIVVALTLTSRHPIQLEYMPVTAIRNLPHLQTLTIQEGRLGALPSGSVSNMTHLTRLLLERNEITALEPYSISYLPKLKKLILSENYLSEIRAACMVDLMALEELYLDRNNISRIESCAFCSMHNLKELELWGNALTDLTEPMFRGLRYLKRIDLYRNRLKVVSSKVFQSMPRLEEIDLKENLLEYISDQAFYGLLNLTRLRLNDNRLKSLSGSVFKYPKRLMNVDVSSNLLETLQEDVIENLANAEDSFFSFRFEKNLLRCSCDLQWVSRYLRKVNSPSFVRELRSVTCQTANGTWEFAYMFKMTCVAPPEYSAPANATSALTSTVVLNSSSQKVLEMPAAENDKGNNGGWRMTGGLGLCLLACIFPSLMQYKRDIFEIFCLL